MSRRIVSAQYQAVAGGAPKLDGYFDRLLKYIPSDIVAAWVAIIGLIAAAEGVPVPTLLWIMFAVFVVMTAVWTYMQTREADMPPAKTQIAIATISFIVWVFALGGPFVYLDFYNPIYGSIVLIMYSLVAGMIKS